MHEVGNTFDWPVGVRLALALALGFLVGLERESARADNRRLIFGGVRTFPIVSLFGFACAWLQQLGVGGMAPGGLLAVLYAALHPEAPLKNLVCMAAPVDADGLVALKAWMGERFDEESLLAQYGNVPAEWVQNALRALRPLGKLAGAMKGNLAKAAGLFNAPASQVARLAAALQEKKAGEEAA